MLKSFRHIAITVLTLSACTQKSSLFDNADIYKFPGLASVKQTGDGTLSLSWENVPVDGAQYQVFRRSKDEPYDWTAPYTVVSTNAYKAPVYKLDEFYCFAVRYFKIGIEPDPNTHEVCPNIAYISGFTGIETAVATGAGGATISWKAPTDSKDIASYGVYLGTGFETLKASSGPNDTSLVVTGLDVDSTVTFGVRALDKFGRTDSNTKTISLKILNNTPLAFKGLDTAVLASASSVKLTWPTPAGIAKEFKVFKATGATGTTPAIDYDVVATTVDGLLTTTTMTGLGDEQAHCFAVRSVSSGLQEDLNVVTKCVNVPDNGAPVFAGLKSILFSGGSANLTWDAAVGETAKYKIYYKEGTTLDYATATAVEIAAPATSYALSGLPDNRSWTFAVRAVDSRNQTDSNTVTTTAYAGDLTAPSFLGYAGGELVADSETQLTVTFNRSTDIDMSHYSIRGKVTGSSGDYVELTTIAQQGAGPISKAITGLLPATSYDIIVKAIDSSGNPSSNTAAKTRATLDLTVPTFNGITSVAGKPGDISKTRVQWTAATDAGGIKEYRVYYSTQSLTGATLIRTATYPLTVGGQTIHMSSAITSGTVADIAGLTENTNYYFVVHAIDNADNEDTNTAQQQYTVPFYTPPAAPTGLAFSGGAGPSSNRYPFVTGNSTAGYKVRIYVDAVAVSTTSINATGAFSIQLSLPNTTGNYVVTAAHLNPSDVEGVSGAVGTYQLVVDTPVATITGAPTESSMSNATALNVTVGGTNVTQYKFAMLTQATACNATINNYSVTWTDVATPITASTGADGAKRLCVIAKNSGGFEQDITAATERNWTKNTQPPAAPTITAVSDPVTNSTSVTYNGVVNVTVSSVAAATHYCAKGNTSEPAAPAAGDSCWTASTTLAAALTGSGGTTTANTIYAWSKDSASNISTSASTSAGTIDYVNICSSGTLATTCTVSTTRTLTAGGVTIGGQGSLVVASGGTINGGVGERNYLTLLGNLTIQNGGIINANVDVNAVNISVLSGGIFRANALGNPGVINAVGGGSGGGQPHSNAGGAGYGGKGGSYVGGASGGPAYGSLSAPSHLGSAGGGGPSALGATGGGAIKLQASQLVIIDGNVSADGGSAASLGGGGSGGSIWIVAQSVSGAGSLSAIGGGGQSAGAGGRIAIHSNNPFLGAVALSGGTTNSSYDGKWGDTGTLYTNYATVCDSGTLSTTCEVTSSVTLGEAFSLSGSGNLVVAPGAELKSYKVMSAFSITMTGNITVQNTGAIRGNSILTAANIAVDSGAFVEANVWGHSNHFRYETVASGSAVGTSTTSNCSSIVAGGGGGHGSWGGDSLNASGFGGPGFGGNPAYGHQSAPLTFGSAGGYCGKNSYGGTGGGAIKLVASGSVTVNGSVTANGGVGSGGGVGGGAGGSVFIQTPDVLGSGTIAANGGAGLFVSGSSGGGGSGGRISMTNTNKFPGAIQVLGGAGGAGAQNGFPGRANFQNQDNYCSSGTLSTTCTISSAWGFADGATLSGVSLVIANGGVLSTSPKEKFTLNFSGDVTIQNGGKILANVTNFSAANFTVDSGGLISAEMLGYLPIHNASGEGTAGGAPVGACCSAVSAGGGAHAALGGRGAGGTQGASGSGGNSIYGNSTAANTFGSAGGASGGYRGGFGGGAIKLSVSGTLAVNGTLSVNGTIGINVASGYVAGGGAGGSINISANTISGNGTITANGGAGGVGTTTFGGGGGAGGYVTITRSSDSFSGTRTANGGAAGNTGAVAGGAGTVTLN